MTIFAPLLPIIKMRYKLIKYKLSLPITNANP